MVISEFKLINKIRRNIVQTSNDVFIGIGDDTAAVKSGDKFILYTCDCLVEDVHFSLKYSTFENIGRKAAAVNLSDIAAMGGVPKHLLVSLFLPPHITEKNINALYRGIKKECEKFGVDIIGGNIAKSNSLIIDIFLTGESGSLKFPLRSRAKVGDLVFVTGTLGDSGAGFRLLNNPPKKNISEDNKYLIYRHLNPTPRVYEGRVISESANAMIDLSDGLSSDIGHICKDSHVGVNLYAEKIPISDSLKQSADELKIELLDLALNGGEDYELCFTVAKDKADSLIINIRTKTNTEVSVIGEIVSKNKGRNIIIDGKKYTLKPKGWNHFKR